MHGINFTFAGNGSLICSMGKKRTMVIAPENAVGRTTLCCFEGARKKDVIENVKMQDALDKAHEMLSLGYMDSVGLWDTACVREWGDDPASFKQIDFIKKLYSNTELKDIEVDFEDLNKYQASVLIDTKMGEKRSA